MTLDNRHPHLVYLIDDEKNLRITHIIAGTFLLIRQNEKRMKSHHFKMRKLCIALFVLFAWNIQAQITVDIKEKPLKEALKQIERLQFLL